MTRSKIAISLPSDQLARVRREVRAGRADSVSGYIARVLAEQEERESLQVLLRDLVEQSTPRRPKLTRKHQPQLKPRQTPKVW